MSGSLPSSHPCVLLASLRWIVDGERVSLSSVLLALEEDVNSGRRRGFKPRPHRSLVV